MKVKIRSCDVTGDSVISEFDTDREESIVVSQQELTKFLKKCVDTHGDAPPVWGKRIDAQEFEEIDYESVDALRQTTDVMIHPMLIGG